MTHTVSFTFKEELSATDHEGFFQAAKRLGEIPGVINLCLLRQTSAKNPFALCLAMEFGDESKYLSNIRQLTNQEMGLHKAGEAYF